MEEPRGTTCKITGGCNQVLIIAEFLEREFQVVHKSRIIEHPESDECHIYLALAEVIPDD